MKTTVALFALLLVILVFPGFTFTSFNDFVNGSGNVVKQQRTAPTYASITVSSGINVYLTQSDAEKIEVETDENLQNLIITEVKNGVLNIYSEKPIHKSAKRNVYISFKQLSEIQANGGSDVYTENPVHLNTLSVLMNGGSDLHLDGDFQTLTVDLNGGSDAFLKGNANECTFKANGGSDVKATDFAINTCSVSAIGGSDAWVNVKEAISVKAIGGSDVYFIGDPKKVESEVRGGSDLKKRP